MSGTLKARIAFLIAIGLLLACALIVYGTDRGFLADVELVQHTQNVEVLLSQTEAVIASAARERLTYVFSGDAQVLAQYEQSLLGIHKQLADLRLSTSDNP
ncbi:MAG TPA: CHASE3 domain-containing protein, partial [Terriglobales bacterium]|nr:CHASE3 domain-containing protein [Terriglobales bacterium]